MKIFVTNGQASYANAIPNLGEPTTSREDFFENPHLFCLVMFTGGEDVSPTLYNETSPKGMCGNNLSRDEKEANIFVHALNNKIPMTGICRGLQFLNVMNGGRMMHHIGHHGGVFHDFETTKDDKIIRVNSLHHQMIITPASAFVIGWSPVRLSAFYYGDKDKKVRWEGPEIEAAYYPETNCAGVQYHPEMMQEDSDGFKWYEEMVTDLVEMTPADFKAKYVNGKRKNNDRQC